MLYYVSANYQKELKKMKKIFSKKFLIILAGILLFAVASAFLISFYISKNKPVELYFIDTENIPSITSIVGERKQDKSKPKEEKEDEEDKEQEEENEEEQKEDKEEKKTAKKAKKIEIDITKEEEIGQEEKKGAKKTKKIELDLKEDKEENDENEAYKITQEDAVPPAVQQNDQIITETYTYLKIENSAEDVGQYITYLMDQYNYIALQDFDSTIEEGSVTLAGDSVMKNRYMQIDIAYAKETYTLTLQRIPGSIEEVIRKKQEEEEQKRQEEEAAAKRKAEESFLSRDQAAQKLNAIEPSALGLEKPFQDYSVVYGYGRTIIDNKECYSMNAYINKNSAMYIAGVFYITCDGSQAYRYDVMNDTYIPVAMQ